MLKNGPQLVKSIFFLCLFLFSNIGFANHDEVLREAIRVYHESSNRHQDSILFHETGTHPKRTFIISKGRVYELISGKIPRGGSFSADDDKHNVVSFILKSTEIFGSITSNEVASGLELSFLVRVIKDEVRSPINGGYWDDRRSKWISPPEQHRDKVTDTPVTFKYLGLIENFQNEYLKATPDETRPYEGPTADGDSGWIYDLRYAAQQRERGREILLNRLLKQREQSISGNTDSSSSVGQEGLEGASSASADSASAASAR